MTSPSRIALCRTAGAVALAVAALSACDRSGPVDSSSGSAHAPVPLNRVSASEVMDEIGKSGLPVPNRRDVTEQKCPEVRCVQALGSDTVSVFKFPTTGLAQQYAGSISSVFQVEDLVVVFAPAVTEDQKRDYERVVKQAAM